MTMTDDAPRLTQPATAGKFVKVFLTLPNKITMARILLVPVFVVELMIYVEGGRELHRWIALGLFTLAAVGDGLDGYLARRLNQRSDLGALLDPIADKLLLVLALVLLTLDNEPRLDRIPIWLTVLVFSRDLVLFLLFVLVHYLVPNATVRPHFIGKCATVLQMACVWWALLKWNTQWLAVMALLTALSTAFSGALYVRYALGLLRNRSRS